MIDVLGFFLHVDTTVGDYLFSVELLRYFKQMIML